LAQRAFPAPSVPHGAFAAAVDTWVALGNKQRIAPDVPWKPIGPAPLDLTGGQLPLAGPGSGRATAVAVHPTTPSRLYLGTAMGGVWRSDNGGDSWRALTDGLPVMAIGALAIDPAAPDTVYAGTGEGSLSGDSYFGRGLLKSIDGGQTWTTLGADVFGGTSIAKILLARGAIYVASVGGVAGMGVACGSSLPAGSGLFKSSDGGKTWNNLVKGDTVDLELDPAEGSTSEIVATFDGATSKVVVLDEANGSQTPVTFAVPMTGRIELARAKTNAKLLYAGGESGVLRSDDGGATWRALANAPPYCGAQCWYDNVVEVDPLDGDTVYLGGSLCAVQKLSQTAGSAPVVSALTIPGGDCKNPGAVWTRSLVHPDVHAIVFDPTNPRLFYVASDGGIAMTDDSGAHWTRKNDGIATNQFYHLCVDPNDSTVVLGGMQDNGTAELGPFPGTTVWNQVGPGDGAACAVNLKDPARANLFVLTSSQFGSVTRVEADGTKSFSPLPFDDKLDGDENFVTLLTQDVKTPTTVYAGTARLFRSTQGGRRGSWTPISPQLTGGSGLNASCGAGNYITAIGVVPDSPRLYTGASTGHIFTSPDGGATWQDVTHPPLPNRWVTAIMAQPSDPKIVYASFSGFSQATSSRPGHIFRSLDAGTTWSRFDFTLEPLDIPFNALRLHPENPNIVYAGTDLGVVATIDGGNTWGFLGSGLPNVAAYELLFHEKDSKLFVGTHGRSAWSFKLEPAIAARQSTLSITIDPSQTTGTATLTIANDEVAGSVLDYTLRSDDAPWLSFSPAAGRASGLIENAHTVTANVAGLAKGGHTGTIVVRDPRAPKPELAISVTLTVP
jgi:photosystem II stability/assembly factor-like uncharacterized protein